MNLVVKGGSWKGAAWTDREGVREGKMLLLLSSSALHLAFYSPFGCKFRCLAKLLRLSLPPAESPRSTWHRICCGRFSRFPGSGEIACFLVPTSNCARSCHKLDRKEKDKPCIILCETTNSHNAISIHIWSRCIG